MPAEPESPLESTGVPDPSWWDQGSGPQLEQGDLLESCEVPLLPDDYAEPGHRSVDTWAVRLIVLTHTCDFLKPVPPAQVLAARVHTLWEFAESSPGFAQLSKWDEVRKQRYPALHLLASPVAPLANKSALVVNFHELFVVPRMYLSRLAEKTEVRFRLRSPYREDLSQAFAAFFMRVALPVPIEVYGSGKLNKP